MLESLRRSRITMSSAFLLSATSRQSKASFRESIRKVIISAQICLKFRKDNGHYAELLQRQQARPGARSVDRICRAPVFVKRTSQGENRSGCDHDDPRER